MLEADIDLSALTQNIEKIKAQTRTGFCFVVKADAYGHGIIEVSLAAQKISDEFAVATYGEAIALKEAGIHKPINILSCPEELLKSAKINTMTGIVPTISEKNQIKYLNGACRNINIKLNSGMNRTGCKPQDLRGLVCAASEKGINIRSFFTHFYKGVSFQDSRLQLNEFLKAAAPYKTKDIKLHACASNCLTLPPEFHLDMVRCGIAAYGYSAVTKPVMTVYTGILQIIDVEKGEHIGYGDFIAPENVRIAAIRAGYGDGYRRKIDEERYVSINGRLCKVLGQVCMDITLVDVSNVKISGGEKVYLLGGTLSGEALAKSYQTIIYEVLTSFNNRVKRNYIRGAHE